MSDQDIENLINGSITFTELIDIYLNEYKVWVTVPTPAITANQAIDSSSTQVIDPSSNKVIDISSDEFKSAMENNLNLIDQDPNRKLKNFHSYIKITNDLKTMEIARRMR